MSQYEDHIIDPTRTQQEYMNELEEMSKTCERVVLHAPIARMLFSNINLMRRYFTRRSFRIQYEMEGDNFIMDHDPLLHLHAALLN